MSRETRASSLSTQVEELLISAHIFANRTMSSKFSRKYPPRNVRRLFLRCLRKCQQCSIGFLHGSICVNDKLRDHLKGKQVFLTSWCENNL